MRSALVCVPALLVLAYAQANPVVATTVEGRVRDGGHPAQAYVYAIPLQARMTPPGSTISRPDGTYTLKALPPGDYRIVASMYPEEIPYGDEAALKPWRLRGRALKLSPGVVVELDLQVEPYE